LRDLAIKRLEEVSLRIKDFKLVKERPDLLEYTLDQIHDNINYLTARDQSNKWQDCVEFNRRLDKSRNQSFTDVTPEFTPYV
jgi:hypothetical protein